VTRAIQADVAGAGLIVLAAICFGTLGPASRFATEAGVEPLALVTWRAALGALFVVAFMAVRSAGGGAGPLPLGRLPGRDRWFLAGASVANTVLNLAMFIAFVRISIALALLVFYLYPALVAVASVLRFGERLDPMRWGALGLSLLGMALVVTGAGGLGELDLVGVALAFAAALSQMFYVLAARHGFSGVPGPQAAAVTMGGATLLYLVIGLLTGELVRLAAPLAGANALWPVVWAGLIGAGVPTMAFVVGIRRLGPSRAAILATLEPVVGVLLAALVLCERPTALQLVGGALILAAAVLLQLRPTGPAAEHEAIGAGAG
jgi:DME family drug/metabolite transporter